MMSGSMYTILLPHVGHMDVRAGCIVSRSLMMDLTFIFLFLLFLFLYFIFRTTQVRVYQSHQSQIDGVVTKLITGLGRMK